ncbi:MAG: DUF4249 domain-containing protein [Bacteroidales bacterium]|jgi:hypothetical protein|nr:DUF4249 domain-containing protein [Bacteroidales bacterium]
MQKFITYISFLIIILLTFSCSTEIEIDTGEFISRPVIEGYIENGDSAWVVITKNQAFFEELNLDITDPTNILNLLQNIFIMDATVIVDDGNIFDTLRFKIDQGIMEGKLIWPPVRYQGSGKIIGQVGGAYNLTVIIDEEIYTAKTTIPKPLIPDTLWFKPDIDADTVGIIHAMITDDPSENNYYRYFAKRLGKDDYFVPGFMSLWDDSFFNGMQFEVIVYRGSLPSYLRDTTHNDVWSKYLVGDTVIVKAATMDRNSYNFWRTLDGSSEVKTNLTGGALGVWCGYGAYYTEPFICK